MKRERQGWRQIGTDNGETERGGESWGETRRES